jgi:hypothetical protein
MTGKIFSRQHRQIPVRMTHPERPSFDFIVASVGTRSDAAALEIANRDPPSLASVQAIERLPLVFISNPAMRTGPIPRMVSTASWAFLVLSRMWSDSSDVRCAVGGCRMQSDGSPG